MTNPSIEHLIERQVGAWSLRQPGREAPSYQPLITVSRTFGARGAALARRLGERTGFAVWDRDLVDAVADEAGGDARVMAALDEHRRTQIDEAVRAFIVGNTDTNIQFFRSLMRIVRTISHHGSAIVVGRGANFAVKPGRALRVRLTAPLEWRVAGVAERSDMTREEARHVVVTRDAEREDFARHYFRSDIAESEHYDLVLNASRFTLEQMADLVLKAYADLFGKHPTPPRRHASLSAG